MRKIIFQLVLFILFASLSTYSQTYTIPLTKYGYYKTITYWSTKANPESTVVTYNSETPFVGKHFSQGVDPNTGVPYERDTFDRVKALKNLGTALSLAPNEKIDLAKLVVETDYPSGSGDFNITFIGNNDNGSNDEEFFHACST